MGLLTGIYRELKGNFKSELCHLRVKPLCSIAFLTYRCTNCCKTCNIWQMGADGSDELDLEGWLKAAENMARLGVGSLEIFGGDALLRKDVIFDLIRRCGESAMDTFFPTNANLCDDATVQRLIDAGLGTLYISLDDLGEANDEVRGVEGNYSKVMAAIENLFRLRGERETPRLVVVCTLSRLNYRNFPRLVEALENYPISAILPRPLAEFSPHNVAASTLGGLSPVPFFVSTDGGSHLIPPGELDDFKAMITFMKRRKNKVYVCWKTYYATTDATYLRGEYPPASCRMATTLMTICPNGDVAPCPMYRSYVLGNIVQGNPDEIWGNERHRRFIDAQQSGRLPICLNCNIRPDHHTSIPDTFRFYGIRVMERMGVNCRP